MNLQSLEKVIIASFSSHQHNMFHLVTSILKECFTENADNTSYQSSSIMTKLETLPYNVIKDVDVRSKDADPTTTIPSSTQTSFDRNFFLCGFVYVTYFMSMAIIGQFLSLFYQSKGFDGKDLGVLTSVVPLTSFLLTPVWSSVIHQEQNKTPLSLSQTTASSTPYALLYATIFLSVIFQCSLAFLDNPMSMMSAKILTGIFHAPVKPLLDALIVGCVDRNVFGKVRLFGILGSGLGSYLGGRILQHTSNKVMVPPDGSSLPWTGFDFLFLAHAVLTVPTVVGIRVLHSIEKSERTNDKKSDVASTTSTETIPAPAQTLTSSRNVASYIFQNLDHCLFFLIIYMIGVSGGVSDTFTYVRFREVGCDTNHMGKSRMLSSMGGAIMFWFSGSLTKALGRENVLLLSLVSVGVRFSLLQTMEGPLQGYVAETIRGSIFGAFWSSATIYASEMVPPSLRAIMLLVLNSVFNGFGRSTGSLIGGRIQAEVGTERLFWGCAATHLSFALVMTLYYHVFRPALQKANIANSTGKNKLD